MLLHPGFEKHCLRVRQCRAEQKSHNRRSFWAAISHSALILSSTHSSLPSFTSPWPAKAEHTLSYLIQRWKRNPIWMLKWGHFNFRVTSHDYNNGSVSQHRERRRGKVVKRKGRTRRLGEGRIQKMNDKVMKECGGKESEGVRSEVVQKCIYALSYLNSHQNKCVSICFLVLRALTKTIHSKRWHLIKKIFLKSSL